MQRLESVISQERVKQIRRRSYERHTVGSGYPTGTDRSLFEYLELLPTFEGRNFAEHIETKFKQTGQPIAVLDIGCGQGVMLGELLDLDINSIPVYPFGVSAFDYRPFLGEDKDIIDPDDEVNYRVGDAHKLSRLFPDIKFDIVVSVATFKYLADPLAALKQAYMVCKEGGLMFIDSFCVPLTKPQADLLRTFWEKNGIKVDLRQSHFTITSPDPISTYYYLAMERGNSSHLPLPFKYAHPGNLASLAYEFDLERAAL